MRIAEFISKVTLIEGKKKSIGIGQVREVMKIVNKLTNGELYKIIRGL